jgi:hypothetical protein
LYGTNGRPVVDVRGGVLTVATRTVADKREWDTVGSFRVVPGWGKVGSACAAGSLKGGGAAVARGRPRREALPRVVVIVRC